MATTDRLKMRLAGIASLFSTLVPVTVFAIHSAIPTPLMKMQPGDLPTSSWAATLNKTMSSGLCKEGSHWRKCYEMSAVDCVQLIDSYTRGCTFGMMDKLPNTLTPTVAAMAGQQVGFCVGELFYKLSQHQLKDSPECQQKPKS